MSEDSDGVCGAGRMVGSWHLECQLSPGHETDGTWHLAHIHDRHEITGPHIRHVTDSTETIEWEPGDLKRALAPLLKNRERGNE